MTAPYGRDAQDRFNAELQRRIRALEANVSGTQGVDGAWHYVGDPGEPAFENSWANAGGADAPVSYIKTMNGWVHIRGAFIGGAQNTVVFTLPVGYRPAYQQEMVIPTTAATNYATCVVGTNGSVLFLAVV